MSRLVLRAPAERAVFETVLPFAGRRRGKVRDVYQLPDTGSGQQLLIVATDRISAFDVVMPTPVAGKGCLLTAISMGWFDYLRTHQVAQDHLISDQVPEIPYAPESLRASLEGRVMVCRAAKVIPIECVARGYLAGSGWNEYRQSASVCGVRLRPGLVQCDRLEEPIFTPSTKADVGHDENISFEHACELTSTPLMERLRTITLNIYGLAAKYALKRGVILADTKFEFGFALDSRGEVTDELLLIDEVLTPDSSRYWPLEGYEPGRDQPSFDKQFLRNYLLGLVAQGKWAKSPPGPAIPPSIVAATRDRYSECARLLFPS
ncbi:MAG: phosphoribosylaminoimidazolesuccinocarboxamide synthase [Phycisphaerales bacterium]|nr:phosphoribosylaminoimidazolesuccinocarboxamide synthase [Phycisphaerales bacterium]